MGKRSTCRELGDINTATPLSYVLKSRRQCANNRRLSRPVLLFSSEKEEGSPIQEKKGEDILFQIMTVRKPYGIVRNRYVNIRIKTICMCDYKT